MPPVNKIEFTPAQHQFLRENWQLMTNQQLADSLGMRLTRVRMELYKLGLKRMELEYWTKEQVQFLRDNYKTIGDTELAEMFNDRWNKAKGWTKKHIEKKRRYLKLQRTSSEKQTIFHRNVESGRFAICPVKAWDKRGRSEEGTVVVWRVNGRINEFIKVNGAYKHLSVHTWETHNGPVPKGFNVFRKDGNPLNNTIENLELITDKELQWRNAQKRAKYPLEIREIEKLLKTLNQKIKKHGTKQNGRLA